MKYSLLLYIVMCATFLAILITFSPGAVVPGLSLGDTGRELFTDFTALYTSGTMLRLSQGADLYNLQVQAQIQRDILIEAGGPYVEKTLAYINPPQFAAVFILLSHLPLPAAYHVWHLINIVLLLSTIALVLKVQGTSAWRAFGLAALGALSFWPVLFSMLQGQSSFVVLFALGMTYAAWKTGLDRLAGAALALALVKPHLVAFVILMALYQRRWRTIAYFSLTALALVAFGWLLIGTDGMIAYITLFRESVGHADANHFAQVPFLNIYDSVQRLGSLYATWLAVPLPGLSAALLIVGVAAVLIASTIRVSNARRETGGSLELQFAYTITVGLLLAPNVHVHDFTLLVLVGLLLIDHFAHAGRARAVARIVVVGHIAPVLLFTLTGEVLMAQLLVSALFVLLVILSLSLRRPKSAPVPVSSRPGPRGRGRRYDNPA